MAPKSNVIRYTQSQNLDSNTLGNTRYCAIDLPYRHNVDARHDLILQWSER